VPRRSRRRACKDPSLGLDPRGRADRRTGRRARFRLMLAFWIAQFARDFASCSDRSVCACISAKTGAEEHRRFREVGHQKRRVPNACVSREIRHNSRLPDVGARNLYLSTIKITNPCRTAYITLFSQFFLPADLSLQWFIAPSKVLSVPRPGNTLSEHRIRFSSQRAYYRPTLLLAPIPTCPAGKN
jgi:hypothetical protein